MDANLRSAAWATSGAIGCAALSVSFALGDAAVAALLAGCVAVAVVTLLSPAGFGYFRERGEPRGWIEQTARSLRRPWVHVTLTALAFWGCANVARAALAPSMGAEVTALGSFLLQGPLELDVWPVVTLGVAAYVYFWLRVPYLYPWGAGDDRTSGPDGLLRDLATLAGAGALGIFSVGRVSQFLFGEADHDVMLVGSGTVANYLDAQLDQVGMRFGTPYGAENWWGTTKVAAWIAVGDSGTGLSLMASARRHGRGDDVMEQVPLIALASYDVQPTEEDLWSDTPGSQFARITLEPREPIYAWYGFSPVSGGTCEPTAHAELARGEPLQVLESLSGVVAPTVKLGDNLNSGTYKTAVRASAVYCAGSDESGCVKKLQSHLKGDRTAKWSLDFEPFVEAGEPMLQIGSQVRLGSQRVAPPTDAAGRVALPGDLGDRYCLYATPLEGATRPLSMTFRVPPEAWEPGRCQIEVRDQGICALLHLWTSKGVIQDMSFVGNNPTSCWIAGNRTGTSTVAVLRPRSGERHPVNLCAPAPSLE